VLSGNVVQDDVIVRGLIDSAHDLLVSHITSDWLQLAPELVAGVASTLEGLNPGESLGETYPALLARASRSATAAATAPAASPGLGLSLTVPLPLSRSPSSGSGVVDSPQLESDVGLSSRVLRPIPRHGYRHRLAPSSVAAGSVSTTAVPPVISLPPATSSRASKKRSRVSNSRYACVSCRAKKRGCSLLQGAYPCAACIKFGVQCVLPPGAFVLLLFCLILLC
jgi:hypothetical protein